ncbi:MAG: PepSY-associated TM helix domain-containing protein [Pseudomonadota bacterium]
MKGAFRQSMTWLHTWAGLVFCWILYFMFVTGTVGYGDSELDRWMKPEQPAPQRIGMGDAVTMAAAFLEREAPGADRWFITPSSDRNEPFLRVFWQYPQPAEGEEPVEPEDLRGSAEIDATTGDRMVEGRDTGGGQVLYRMHYILHYIDRDIAYRFIGVVTMLMFVGIISGIVVHKKIFKDFFTFRPSKGQRSWLDMHNLMSVSSLPFQLMITYSGLIFMVTTWMPGIALGSYGFDIKRAQDELSSIAGIVEFERSGNTAQLTALAPILVDAAERWGDDAVRNIEIRYPGDEASQVTINRREGIERSAAGLIYSGTTGEFMKERPPIPSASASVALTMLGLHEGLFAGPVLRWLYIFSGVLGTAMVATGAIYWTAKRKKTDGQPQGRGYRFVEALNVGTIMGLPTAIAAYFIANRLLPVEMASRADWEVHIMFLVWGALLLHPVLRPIQAAWREQAWLAAVAFAAVPLVNAATTSLHLVNTVSSGDWSLAAIDLSCIALAVSFAVVAAVLGKSPAETKVDAKAPIVDALDSAVNDETPVAA